MDRVSAARLLLRAVVTASAMLAMASGAFAQALTEPNARTKPPLPSAAAKALPDARAKSCSIYGDGFVYAPGTGTCIKVGGNVTLEVGRR